MAIFTRKQPSMVSKEPEWNESAPAQMPAVGIDKRPEMPDAVRTMQLMGAKVIDKDTIREATGTLQKYKDGKASLENRVIKDEQWYKMRHWEEIRGAWNAEHDPMPEPASGWLFNTILNKHADMMDNIPAPTVLPRERSDEQSAKTLSAVLPVIMEYNNFEDVYSEEAWEKLKHGTAVYGIFWNKDKENGLGDIDIKGIDLLNIFWEPGIQNIQDSKNLFITEMVDNSVLEAVYPQLKGKLGGLAFNVAEYIYDDTIDTSDKSIVIDWYYKVKDGTRTVLHYCKFVGDNILYASQNEPATSQSGYYDHGMYPVVFDSLFPEKGTPVGFGYVAICKDAQTYIDKLSSNILKKSLMDTKPRYWAPLSSGVSEAEFSDWDREIVHYDGDPDRIKPFDVSPISGIYYNILEMKVNEMKEVAANRDTNSGGAAAGVTAASAIAAMQEAGNKSSRDLISASYRAYSEVVTQIIELMRQFYQEVRIFRITGETAGSFDYVNVSQSGLQDQVAMNPDGTPMIGADGQALIRRPVFDLKIKAQKRNPFSRMEENERALNLYSAGFFNPERAQEALGCLEMMDFEGIDKVKEFVSQGQTLMNLVNQYSQIVAQMTGVAPDGSPMGPAATPQAQGVPMAGPQLTDSVMKAQTPMTSYGQRLAKRSAPSVEGN